jgi:hypothetical protein
MDFFYADTTIMIGDGHPESFWHSPWLDREKAQGHRTFHICHLHIEELRGPQGLSPRVFNCKIEQKYWHIFKSSQ